MMKKFLLIFLLLTKLAFAIDDNDANTFLLCHFNGVDGATTDGDSSVGGTASPQTLTFANAAQLDTAEFKFGTTSLLAFGLSKVNITPLDDFHLLWATGAWSIDAWAKVSSLTVTGGQIYESRNDDPRGVAITYGKSGANAIFGITLWGATTVTMSSGVQPFNTWHHIAIEAYGGTMYFYVNGVVVDTDTPPDMSAVDASTVNYVGNSSPFGGLWVDEFRISNVSRYQGTGFTPETGEYPEAPPAASRRVFSIL